MEPFESETPIMTATSEETADYLYDMIEQMVHLAHSAGQDWVAMHLEAIVIARRAIAPERPEH